MSISLTLENGIEISVQFPSPPTLEFAVDNETEFVAAVGTVTTALSDYEQLNNMPSIEGVTLVGNHTQEELGVNPIGNAAILALFS
jgi:hypothetical protein